MYMHICICLYAYAHICVYTYIFLQLKKAICVEDSIQGPDGKAHKFNMQLLVPNEEAFVDGSKWSTEDLEAV